METSFLSGFVNRIGNRCFAFLDCKQTVSETRAQAQNIVLEEETDSIRKLFPSFFVFGQ
jgi:hypothetical protein